MLPRRRHLQAPLEHGKRAVQVVPAHVKDAKPQAHRGEARRVIDLLRDPHTLFAEPHALRELAQLGQAARHPLPTGDRGNVGKIGRPNRSRTRSPREHIDVPPQDDDA